MNSIPYQEKLKYFSDDSPFSEIPDIFDLYQYYNANFFEGLLSASIIKWSKKLTLCAGTCKYEGQKSCTITLSEPLLKFRTNNELKETLLHEMIHAYYFITNPESCKVNEGHGPNFIEMMIKLNSITGLNISVYHNFHDEVDRCRQHIWKCNGICSSKPPFYGFVKRSMNRPPQKADYWFERHQQECGGTFEKISEPEKVPKEKRKIEQKKEVKKIGKNQVMDVYMKKKDFNFLELNLKVENIEIKMRMMKSLEVKQLKVFFEQFLEFVEKSHCQKQLFDLMKLENECIDKKGIEQIVDLNKSISNENITFEWSKSQVEAIQSMEVFYTKILKKSEIKFSSLIESLNEIINFIQFLKK